MDAPRPRLAIALALIAPAIAGCLSPAPAPASPSNPAPTEVAVPAPRVGATYAYEGDDGSRLDVAINGSATRLDRALQEQPVVRVTWTLTTPDGRDRSPPEATFRFREHVDPATGRIVQQVGVCGVRRDHYDNDFGRCWDERAMVIFSAAGLPGAFGAGPHWNRTLNSSEDVSVAVDPLGGDPEIAYRVNATTVGNRSCVELSASAPETGVATGLHWTVVDGPTVLCPGQALPVRFAGWDGRTYRLVDHDAGGERIDVGGPAPTAATGLLEDRSWSAPFLVADPTDPAEYSVREAHRVALNRSDPYRELWETADDPLLSGTSFMNDSGSVTVGSGTPAERRWHSRMRCVTVQDPDDGRTAEVCVEKEAEGPVPDPEQSASYSVEREETETIEAAVNRSAIPDRQASIASARRVAQEVMGEEPFWWAERYGAIASRWSPQRQEGPVPRSDGYSLSVFFRDPTPEGGMVNIPYQYRFDGPTGTVQWLDINRTKLPLVDHV